MIENLIDKKQKIDEKEKSLKLALEVFNDSYEELKSKCPVKAQKYEGQALSKDKLNIICGSFYMLNSLFNKKI